MKKQLKGVKVNDKGEYLVRLNYLGKRYSVINYTKKYGCRNIDEVEDKIKEFKRQLSRKENPFEKEKTFGELFYEYLDKKLKNNGTQSYSINKSMYDKHCKYHLHEVLVSDLCEEQLKYIYEDMKDLKNDKGEYRINSIETIRKMKRVISPIYFKLYDTGKIDINYIKIVDIGTLNRSKKFQPLNVRLKEQNYREIVKKLYKGIMNIKEEKYRMYILFTFMTMRRRSETFKITKKNVFNNVITITEDMSKTKIYEKFLIPEEIVDYINTNENEFVLKCPTKKYLKLWKELLKKEGIESDNFRLYDSRHLFMSIMSRKFNTELVGSCISHYKGDINELYNSYPFEDRKEVMESYWSILRD